MFSRSKKTTELGASFRPARLAFGSVPMVWSVEDLRRGTDGQDYALLVNTADRTQRKTVAVNALLDPTLFVPAQG